MPFSRYLYSKVKEAKALKQDLITVLLNPQEVEFLKKLGVPYTVSETPSSYIVDSTQLKEKFCM